MEEGPTLLFEEQAHRRGYRLIAGVDEAGRGPLAGPVVAAACILPSGISLEGLNDSKKLSSGMRNLFFQRVSSDPDVCIGTAVVNSSQIDKLNILQATMLAMLQAIEALLKLPDFVLIDGNRAPNIKIPFQTIVKGDQLSLSIAAASVIAKVTRDRLMEEYHDIYPQYGFASHKGYATKEHLEALHRHGPCPIHRTSFAPLKMQEQLEFPFF